MEHRNRGGQPGNQNARKNGFYSKVLSAKQKHTLEYASEVKGLDQEIALVRLRLQSLLECDSPDIRLIDRLARTLAVLIKASHDTGSDEVSPLKEAILGVFAANPLLAQYLDGAPQPAPPAQHSTGQNGPDSKNESSVL